MDKLLQTNDEQEHKEKIRNTIKMNNRKKRKRNKEKTRKKTEYWFWKNDVRKEWNYISKEKMEFTGITGIWGKGNKFTKKRKRKRNQLLTMLKIVMGEG